MEWDYFAFSVLMIGLYLHQEANRRKEIRLAAAPLENDPEVRNLLEKTLPAVAAFVLAVLLLGGWLLTEEREYVSRLSMQEANKGLGILMGYELEKSGHAGLQPRVPADDSAYASIADLMAQWTRLDSRVEKVYTLRSGDGGNIEYIVVPQSGRGGENLAGEIKGQLRPGAFYRDAPPELTTAFAGQPSFHYGAGSDRWGTPISMFVPLRKASGEVEAVLGIDFHAGRWRNVLLTERLITIAGLALLILLLNSFYWAIFRLNLRPLLVRWHNAELKESEERFCKLADNAPVLMQIADAAGDRHFFNQTWVDYTGRGVDNLRGDGWLMQVHPDDRESFAASYSEAVSRRAALHTEFRLRDAAGEYRWMLGIFMPRWQEEVFAGYMGSCVDITTHKQLEQALEHQVKFEKLVAAVSATFVDLERGGLDGAIKSTLGEVGRFVGADQVYIYLFSEDRASVFCTHEWHAVESAAAKIKRPAIRLADAPWMTYELIAKKRLFIPQVAEMPEIAEKALLLAKGIQSLVAVPLTCGDRQLGFLGLNSQRREKIWRPDDILLPKLVGEIFAGAIRRQQAEEALERSEAKNKAIIASVPDMIFSVTRTGVIHDIKPSGVCLGQPDARLAGENLSGILPAHLVKPALDAIDQAFISGELQRFEFYVQPDGKTSYYEARVTRAGGEDTLMIVRDITDRRRSEACDLLLLDIAVKVLEETPLEDILTFTCQQIMAIFDLKLIWVGRKEPAGSVRLFTAGDEATDFVRGLSVRWDETPRGMGPTGTAIRTGKVQMMQLDDPHAEPWRDKLAEYATAAGMSFPLKVGGMILGALTVCTDDTAFWTKRAVVHLTNFAEQIAMAIHSTTNRQRLKLLTTGLKSTANAVVITDRTGNIQWVNPAFAELTGLSAVADVPVNIRGFLIGTESPAFYKVAWRQVLSGKAWQGEIAGGNADGTDFIAEMSITPVREENGEIANFIAILQDVTQRRQTEREMAEARETVARAERINSLGVMAAGIAHEINQPLNSLKVMADGMLYWQRQGKTPALTKIMDNIEKISKQADRIDSIVKHMRSFVRSSQCGHPHPCDVNVAVEEALSLIGTQLAAHGIGVRTELAGNLPAVMASSTQLEEVVINILVNAMQSLDAVAAKEKWVVIETGCRNGDVYLEITDNGPGVSPQIKDKIFEPFFTTKPAGEGMGLGLSIVHSIVTSYDGKVSIRGLAQGDGVTFRIEFPAGAEVVKGEKPA